MGPPPRHQVVTSAKDAVASGVTGVVGLARQSRRWSVELKRSMSHAVDVVLGKSEELVDHFLPMTEEELGEACGRPLPRPPAPLLPRAHPQRPRVRELWDSLKATWQISRKQGAGAPPRPPAPLSWPAPGLRPARNHTTRTPRV